MTLTQATDFDEPKAGNAADAVYFIGFYPRRASAVRRDFLFRIPHLRRRRTTLGSFDSLFDELPLGCPPISGLN
jgi:hypothetical protein